MPPGLVIALLNGGERSLLRDSADARSLNCQPYDTVALQFTLLLTTRYLLRKWNIVLDEYADATFPLYSQNATRIHEEIA
jgi:hypothetical protein